MRRFKPEPIPAINPLPEYLVEGRTRELYEDTKSVLQVPWMGVVTMAFAHYLEFYELFWKTTRPMMASKDAVDAYERLRKEIEEDIKTLLPPSRYVTLRGLGYAPREIENIKQTLEVFSHGNFFYAILATLSRLALELNDFPSRSDASHLDRRHAPEVEVPFILMEEHHADDQTKAIYDSIRINLGLPFVNTDYRCLARWPSYLRVAWSDLVPIVATPEYEAVVENVHHRFAEEVMQLPNPTGTGAEELRQAADRAASVDEILAVVQLFQWLLPGLITNVAFFRAQLQ